MVCSADINHDAELLEASTKKNDKYTVRRIIDVHSELFRIKPQRNFDNIKGNLSNQISYESEYIESKNSEIKCDRSNSLSSIFFNILHFAIENNSNDVLRICLKHNLSPNEPGTTYNKVNKIKSCEVLQKSEDKQVGHDDCKKTKSTRFPIACTYCLNKEKSFQAKTGKYTFLIYSIRKTLYILDKFI